MLQTKIPHYSNADVFLEIFTNFTVTNLLKIFENFICHQLGAGEKVGCVRKGWNLTESAKFQTLLTMSSHGVFLLSDYR